MKIFMKFYVFLILSCHLKCCTTYWFDQKSKQTKCFAVPSLQKKVEKVMNQCQAEVNSDIIDDLLSPFNENPFELPIHHHAPKDVTDHSYYGGLAEESLFVPNWQPLPYIPSPQHHSEHHHETSNVHGLGHYASNYHHEPTSHQPHQHHVVFEQSPEYHHLLRSPPPFIAHSSPSQQPELHHHYHQQLSKPINVIEAHQALSQVLAVNMPKILHDNHHEISAILEKLGEDKLDANIREVSDSNMNEKRNKRSLFEQWSKQTREEDASYKVIKNEDRWLAGCLLHCVFRKNGALDKFGNPTLDGLTDLFTSGANADQAFFVYVLRSVDKCLAHYIFQGNNPSIKGERCDVAFNVFFCISDLVADFCSS